MKSLVVYSSKSGNTRKMAEAVFEYLRGEKEIVAVADAPDPAGYSFVAVGFWLKAGQPDPDSQAFLARLKEGQAVYLFATHGAAATSAHAENGMKKAKELAGGAHVVSTYLPAQKDPLPAWVPDAPAAKGRPDANDLKMVVRMLEELDLP